MRSADHDLEGLRLLKRIADKAVEPFDGPAEKTVSEWRKELAALHMEAIQYFISRHAAFGRETDLEG